MSYGKTKWMGAALVLALACTTNAQVSAQPQRPAAAPQPPTPRSADGHPDLNGYWGPAAAPGAGPGAFATGPSKPDEKGDYISPMTLRNGDISNLTNDGVIGRRSTDNLPLYKPQYWEKVQDLDYNGNVQDPFNSCMPPSVPRIGLPRRILQTPNEVHFFYSITFQRNDYRSIPVGPRTEQPDRDGTWMGTPVAHWDGETLVVETIGFTNDSWFGPQGYIHGYDMKVTESFRREGNRLIYNSTVEDPEYLQKPWVKDQQTLALITTPGYHMDESPPCSDRNIKEQVGKQREM
jgi:hypothetical protein